MKLSKKMKDEFYPNIYPISLPVSDNLELCLMKKKGLGRYCIALINIDDVSEIDKKIQDARRLIKKSTKAIWLIKEVGVYIVFRTNSSIVGLNSIDLKVDTFGFHAVIIQGVHLIDINENHIFNHSKWFQYTFGESESIVSKLTFS